MSEWYYAENHEQKGPVHETELKEKLASKDLPLDTLIWSEGMEKWKAAKEVEAFQFTTPPPPPVSPAASIPSPQFIKEEDTLEELCNVVHCPENMEVEGADFKKNKLWAILGYIYVFFVITLVMAPRSPYARYHANQGLTLFLFGTLWWALLTSLSFFLFSFFPSISGPFLILLSLAPIPLMVVGILNAAQGKAKPLPLIGQFTLLR